MINAMKLVFEFFCENTGCICHSVTIAAPYPTEIKELIKKYNLKNNLVVELTNIEEVIFLYDMPDEIDKIDCVTMRYGVGIDELSYISHNSRELALMLQNDKPLSFFMDQKEYILDDSYPYQYFKHHVETGTIIEFLTDDHPAIHCKDTCILLYALPNETWRIKAFLDNMMNLNRGHWSQDNEIQEGLLLGYTKEQMDEYIIYLRKLRSNSETLMRSN